MQSFDLIDRNHDGVLSRAELENYVRVGGALPKSTGVLPMSSHGPTTTSSGVHMVSARVVAPKPSTGLHMQVQSTGFHQSMQSATVRQSQPPLTTVPNVPTSAWTVPGSSTGAHAVQPQSQSSFVTAPLASNPCLQPRVVPVSRSYTDAAGPHSNICGGLTPPVSNGGAGCGGRLPFTSRQASMPSASGVYHTSPLKAAANGASSDVIGVPDTQAERVFLNRTTQETAQAFQRKEIVDLIDERVGRIYELISQHANHNDERFAHLEAERLDLSQRVDSLHAQVLSLAQDVRLAGAGGGPQREMVVSGATETLIGQLRAQMSQLHQEFGELAMRQREDSVAVEGLHDLESRLVQHLEVARTDQQTDHVRLREDLEQALDTSINGGGSDMSTLQRKCDELAQAMEIHLASARQMDMLQPLETERQERNREIGELVEFVQGERQHRIQHVEELALRQQRLEEDVARMTNAALERFREDLRAQKPARQELEGMLAVMVRPEREARQELGRCVEAERSGRISDLENERGHRIRGMEELRSAIQRVEQQEQSGVAAAVADMHGVKHELECSFRKHREESRRELIELQVSLQEQLGKAGMENIAVVREELVDCNERSKTVAFDLLAERTQRDMEHHNIAERVFQVEQAPPDALRRLEHEVAALRVSTENSLGELEARVREPGEGAIQPAMASGSSDLDAAAWRDELRAVREQLSGEVVALRERLLEGGKATGLEVAGLEKALRELSGKVDTLAPTATGAEGGALALKPAIDKLEQAIQTESVNRHTSMGEVNARMRQDAAVLAGQLESKWQDLLDAHRALLEGRLSAGAAGSDEEKHLLPEYRRAIEKESADRALALSELRVDVTSAVAREAVGTKRQLVKLAREMGANDYVAEAESEEAQSPGGDSHGSSSFIGRLFYKASER